MSESAQRISAVAYYTFKEIIKSKILYNVLLLGFALVLVTYVAFNFTYGEVARVALDFGLGMLSLSSVGIAFFIGIGLLSKEVESRTVYMIISRPISRSEFILGKLLGLIAILVINIFLLTLFSLSCYVFLGGELYSLIGLSVVYTFIESCIVLFVVALFSLLTTPTMTFLLSLAIYIVGHGIGEIYSTTFVQSRYMLKSILSLYEFFLPAFHKLNVKSLVVYNKTLPMDYSLQMIGYGIFYLLALLLLILFVFRNKDLE